MAKRVILIVLMLLMVISIPLTMTRAQSTPTVISLAVPDFMKDSFTPDFFKDFESAHPGVTVNLVSQGETYPPSAQDIQKHLDGVQKYVSSADVVYVDGSYLTEAGTQAGYFLDLSPLIDADKTFNADDFYPRLWQSFQWDKGIWALPTSATPMVLSYDPNAFDKAGLAYPTDKWSFDDLVQAARALTQKDANGNTSVYGLGIVKGLTTAGFLAALIDGGIIDNSTVPAGPQLDTPSAEKVLDTWAKLESDNIVTAQFDQAAMSIVPVVFVAIPSTNPNQKRVATVLPGGKTGLETQGFAVSVGTQHPDLAYALANYLTMQREAAFDPASVPARKSVANAAPTGNQRGPTIKLPADVQPLIDQALTNGLSAADFRYTDYLDLALQKMENDHLDAHSALLAAEDQAVSDQKVALAKKGTTAIVIPTPAPVVVQPGKITLNFGMDAFVRPFPNQDKWNQLMQDFAASDPQVGKINMDVGNPGNFDLTSAESKYDCFYLPYNAVPGAKLDGLLSLDPLMSADKTFDKSDFVGTTLTQVQVNGKTWALPINIQPSILKYNSDEFSKAGVTLPTNTWTVDAFNDALKALKADPNNPPFVPTSPGGTHLLMLMAAYGGIPLDYRTNPPTVNLTDPATVQAIQQVLDLARNGYMKYSAIGGTQMIFLFQGKMNADLITQELNGFQITRGGPGNPQDDPYKPVLYPTGTKYNAVSYELGTAYISSTSSNPDACYRWISTVAQHPDLFSAMPARHSLINDPAISASQGPDLTAAYNQIDTLLKDPNALSFPSMFQGGATQIGFLYEHWIYQAFDQYVLQNADLTSALKDADNYIKSFQACTANIPPYDASSTQTEKDYFNQYLDCAAKVDPTLKPLTQGLK